MKRDYGSASAGSSTRMRPPKTLGIEKVGLHDCSPNSSGKARSGRAAQRLGKRPLSDRQLEYAFADVGYLIALREKLGEQLSARGLVEEAEAEFARLSRQEPARARVRPRGLAEDEGRARLGRARAGGAPRAVPAARPARRDLNPAAFKVLVRSLPRRGGRGDSPGARKESCLRVPGTSPITLKKVGAQLLEAVRKASMRSRQNVRGPAVSNGQRWRRGAPGAPSPEIEERYERLRAWPPLPRGSTPKWKCR